MTQISAYSRDVSQRETAAKDGQLALDLGFRPALARDDFLVSASNEAAITFLDSWPNWPHYAVLIFGPEGCGKTHLAHVWQARSGALLHKARTITQKQMPNLSGHKGIVVEDVDQGPIDQQALFHLLNLARTDGFHVVMTARTPPSQWEADLPDFLSRVKASPLITIGTPDDALLNAVLLKQFADRQLWLEPHVLSYTSLRMERSMAGIGTLVKALDQAALASKRKVTRQLVADVLKQLGN